MDPELEHLAHLAQWLEPSNTRSRKAPIERLHFVKRSMTRKAIMHPNRRVSMQCMQGQDGKFYYIPLDAYNPDHLQIISEFSPLLVNPTPAQFEPGAMYTYIIASIIRKDPVTNMDIQEVPAKLYATKAMNMFEFGTKHHQIFYRMASTDELDRVARTAGIPMDELQYGLHASGEIHCITPTSLKFNFYSGTYKMQNVIPRRRAKYEMGLIISPSMSRQMPLHAMSLLELRSRANELKLPVQPDHDRMTIIKMIQQSTTSKGGKKRTVKRRTHCS
jgi:hypothetical protein